MRKAAILLITLILVAILVYLVVVGFDYFDIKILSYVQLGDESTKLEMNISEYEEINSNSLKEKEIKMQQEIEAYEDAKKEYENKLAEREASLALMGTGNLSDIDFLLVKIGNYATEHKVNLLFDVTKNISDPDAEQYVVTDLNFTAEGIYFEVAQFINKLEKDERLTFEIRDFRMKNGGNSELVKEGIKDGEVDPTVIDPNTGIPYGIETESEIYNVVKATFKVYGIPVKKSTLLELTSSQELLENSENNTNTNTNTSTSTNANTNTSTNSNKNTNTTN